MATLLRTNPFLANLAQREAMLRRSALDSSYFEGARGLPSPKSSSPPDLRPPPPDPRPHPG